MCVIWKKRGKLQLRCSKCWLRENCGPKSVVVKIGIFSPCSLGVSARRKTNTFNNFIGSFYLSLKNIFFNRILAENLWQYFHSHLATLLVSTIHSDCHFTMRTGERMQRIKLVARMPCPHTLCFCRCRGVFCVMTPSSWNATGPALPWSGTDWIASAFSSPLMSLDVKLTPFLKSLAGEWLLRCTGGVFPFYRPVPYALFQCIFFNASSSSSMYLGHLLSIRVARALRPCDSPWFAFGNISNHDSYPSQAQKIPEELPQSRRFFNPLWLATIST